MADFAIIHEQDVLPVWINLDYVVRINPGLDPHEPTSIHFRDGTSIVVSRPEGSKLIAQLNQCCHPRQKQSRSRAKPQPRRGAR